MMKHEERENLAVDGRRSSESETRSVGFTAARPELVVREKSAAELDLRSAGIRDALGGLFLIGIGFLWGSSVYMGNPTALDWLFDSLATYWLARGVFRLITSW